MITAAETLTGGPTVTDWIEAAAAILTFALAGIALLYARNQVREARQSREQARELEVEKSQPYVVAFMESSEADQSIVDLVIRNYGQTAARDVTIELSPEPRRAANSSKDDNIVALPDRIPILAPGQEWRTMWDAGRQRNESDLPDRHEGTVQYLGIGAARRSSEIVLDWSIYKHRQWIVVRGVHHVAEALRDIRDNQKKWTEDLNDGLNATVRDGDAKDAKRAAEIKARTTKDDL